MWWEHAGTDRREHSGWTPSDLLGLMKQAHPRDEAINGANIKMSSISYSIQYSKCVFSAASSQHACYMREDPSCVCCWFLQKLYYKYGSSYLASVCLQWWWRRPSAVPVQHSHSFTLSLNHAETFPFRRCQNFVIHTAANSEWWITGLMMIWHASMYAHQGCIPGQPGWEPRQLQDTVGWTPHRRNYPPGAVPSPGMPWKPLRTLWFLSDLWFRYQTCITSHNQSIKGFQVPTF